MGNQVSIGLELNRQEWLCINCHNSALIVTLNKANILGSSDKYFSRDESFIVVINDYEFSWNPYEVLNQYLGVKIQMLWFGEHSLMIYFCQSPILQCQLLMNLCQKKSLLFWEQVE